MADDVRPVAPESWVEAITAARGEGWSHLDWLGAVDELGRSNELRVVVRLLNPTTALGIRLETRLTRDVPALASLGAVLPGAVWHEREATDLYGIHFTGGDDRPLLVAGRGEPGELLEHPLRKDAVLAARVAIPWPGFADDGDSTRRRMAPPGVPDPEVFGHRDSDAPALDPTALTTQTRRRR
ncbi:MAG TPA: NADH-quinone oxidoreductase subunit C [Propionibacteriaceae bacterium]|nr:NADH-quinone oxidoreductase subunit C [Propionibacteriaceae bacterium]